MKISPMPSQGNTVGAISGDPAPPTQNLRSMRMNTNATPGRVEAQLEALPPAVTSDPKLSISDPNDPTKTAAEDTEPLSPQFAALAKQKRALQVKERELLAREKALEGKPSTQDDVIPKARLKAEPLKVLLEEGVTYDQLTEAILANQNGNLPEIQDLRAQIKALKEGVDQQLTERDTRAEQQALAAMRREAIELSTQGEDFEMVRETRSVPDVMKLIERTYRESGEVLDVREALQLVENALIDRSLKIAGLKKVQQKLAPAEPAPAPQTRQQGMRTLTNRDTASVPLSAKQRALQAFVGQLKR